MTTNSHFRIGDGVGLVGRWFRLFIGGKVGLSLAAIVAIYFVVFYAIGELRRSSSCWVCCLPRPRWQWGCTSALRSC